ncbi:MAG: CRISPR-associated endoribonuclease Cas6 [Sulfurimonas sp.]
MLIINAKIPTVNLPVKRVLPKLFQSFVYTTLEDKEHEGYKHSNGKVFKSMNFRIVYRGNDLSIRYTALNKAHEKAIAQKILFDGLKLGEIHIASTEVSLQHRQALDSSIKVGGFVAAAIKDGNSSKKIYLEPKTHKFQDIIRNHTLQKYEALFGKPYEGEFVLDTVGQKPRERIFSYEKGAIKSWYGVYEIKATEEMLGMILDTGLGAHGMQGLGFVEETKSSHRTDSQKGGE